MARRIICASLFMLLLASCNNPVEKKEPLALAGKAALTAPEQTVKDYISWYLKNMDRISKIDILNKIPEGDTTTFYSVDFSGAKKFTEELKKSGYVSDLYINEFNKFFKDIDDTLKINHQNDGPVDGLDADLVLGVQDYSDIETGIDSAKFINTSEKEGHCATSSVFGAGQYKIVYHAFLTKKDNRWLIDSLYRKD